mmetsp:Transcript_55100/g.134882  ORF Transcript_55100/g.134882 Transcript_55100/m.134882 type:complete len:418 (+) Transcript_55100:1283-2536(+)
MTRCRALRSPSENMCVASVAQEDGDRGSNLGGPFGLGSRDNNLNHPCAVDGSPVLPSDRLSGEARRFHVYNSKYRRTSQCLCDSSLRSPNVSMQASIIAISEDCDSLALLESGRFASLVLPPTPTLGRRSWHLPRPPAPPLADLAFGALLLRSLFRHLCFALFRLLALRRWAGFSVIAPLRGLHRGRCSPLLASIDHDDAGGLNEDALSRRLVLWVGHLTIPAQQRRLCAFALWAPPRGFVHLRIRCQASAFMMEGSCAGCTRQQRRSNVAAEIAKVLVVYRGEGIGQKVFDKLLELSCAGGAEPLVVLWDDLVRRQARAVKGAWAFVAADQLPPVRAHFAMVLVGVELIHGIDCCRRRCLGLGRHLAALPCIGLRNIHSLVVRLALHGFCCTPPRPPCCLALACLGLGPRFVLRRI